MAQVVPASPSDTGASALLGGSSADALSRRSSVASDEGPNDPLSSVAPITESSVGPRSRTNSLVSGGVAAAPSGSNRRSSATPSPKGNRRASGGGGMNAANLGTLKKRDLKHSALAKDIWALGITIVLGGQLIGWNPGFSAGFGTFFICTIMIGTGYIAVCACEAEMTSAMPFAGGAYGFSRITLGTYCGFLVGSSETFEYILYVSAAALTFGQILTSMLATPITLEPLWWIILLGVSCTIQIIGGQSFWRFNLIAAVLTVIISILYLFFTLPTLDFPTHAPVTMVPNSYFVDGLTGYFTVLPLASWWYVGVEALPLAAEETHEPKKNIPKGMMWCVGTLFVLAILSCIFVASSPPGIEYYAVQLMPLSYIFSSVLHISERLAAILTLPSAFTTTFGFIWCYSRQMFAMSRSGLFPSFLSKTYGQHQTPIAAILCGSLIAYLILILIWFIPEIAPLTFQLCIGGAYIVYIAQFASFLMLRHYYPSLKRNFTVPLGKPVAIYGIFVFAMGLIGVLGFRHPAWFTPTVTGTYLLLCSLYYWLIARHNQVISPEEEAVLFVAYVIRSNMMKARGNKGGRRSSVVSPGHRGSLVDAASGALSSLGSRLGQIAQHNEGEDHAGEMTLGKWCEVMGAWIQNGIQRFLLAATSSYRVEVDTKVAPEELKTIAEQVDGSVLPAELQGTIRIVRTRPPIQRFLFGWLRR